MSEVGDSEKRMFTTIFHPKKRENRNTNTVMKIFRGRYLFRTNIGMIEVSKNNTESSYRKKDIFPRIGDRCGYESTGKYRRYPLIDEGSRVAIT
jgi:hypothetical protein